MSHEIAELIVSQFKEELYCGPGKAVSYFQQNANSSSWV